MTLTKRQKEVLDFLVTFHNKHGYSPSFEEIARSLKLTALAGRIAAGRPLEAIEESETLSLGEFARSDKTFVLQVKGSSMIDDHILNGDYVVIEPTQVANPGEIVVGLVGNDEATLTRFYSE